jgi:hypothetical protein
MYHCDACGGEGETPAEARKPTFLMAPNAWWYIKVCPECREEVHEAQVVKIAICLWRDHRGIIAPVKTSSFEETQAERPIAGKLEDAPLRFGHHCRAAMTCPKYTIGYMRMNVEPTAQQLDDHFFELRSALVDSLFVVNIAQELQSSPRAAQQLLNLYTQLGTLQGVVRHVRRALKRSIRP